MRTFRAALRRLGGCHGDEQPAQNWSGQGESPPATFAGVASSGVSYITGQINAVDNEFVAALEAFKPVNKTCNTLVDQKVPLCRNCIVDKCTKRGKSACSPAEWQRILGQTIGFFSQGVPNFFTSTIPDVVVNKIGGAVIDIGGKIGDFFTDKIGGGVVDLGNKIGSGITDLGGKIGSGFKDLGNKVVDIGSTAIDKIKDIGSSIGDAFKSIGSIFGKRSVDRPPNCDELADKNRAGPACQYYAKPNFCPDCSINTDTLCPGYKAALNRAQAAQTNRAWRAKMGSNTNYQITNMMYDPTAFDPATSGFRGVVVSVQIFGKSVTFTADQPISAYNPAQAGPVVARMALELFKKA